MLIKSINRSFYLSIRTFASKHYIKTMYEAICNYKTYVMQTRLRYIASIRSILYVFVATTSTHLIDLDNRNVLRYCRIKASNKAYKAMSSTLYAKFFVINRKSIELIC